MDAKRNEGFSPRTWSLLAWSGSYLLAVVVGAVLLSRGYGLISWPAAGVAVTWAVTRPSLREAALGCAAMVPLGVVGSLVAIHDVGAVVVFAAGNALLPLAVRGALDLHRRSSEGPSVDFGVTRDLLLLGLACFAAATLTAPTWAVMAELLHNGWEPKDLAGWAMRNASSSIVIATVVLQLRRQRDRGGAEGGWLGLPPSRLVEASAIAVWTVFFGAVIFTASTTVPVTFGAFGIAAWVALRLGPTATAVFCGLIGSIVTLATLDGHGQFASLGDPIGQASMVQLWSAMTMLVAMVLALSVGERDHLIERLQQSEDRANAGLQFREAISQNIVEALLVIDSAEEVLYANVAANRYGDLRMALTSGLFDLTGREVAEDDLPHRRALAGESVTEQRLVSEQGGHRLVLSFTATRLVGFGTVDQPAAIMVVRDVTTEQESNDSLREFVGVVAHDLKSPLSLVTSWAGFAKDYVEESGVMSDPDHVIGMLERIERGGNRMRDLIDDLLTHALASESQLTIEEVDLGDLVREVVRDTLLDDAVVVGALPVIPGDRRLLRQVCENILGNAVKYVAPGTSPVIRVGSRYESSTHVAITFDDNGIGIDPADVETIFSPFKRLNPDYPGTGLGLAICRSIVDRHEGRLIAEPRVGGGTTFTMVLPMVRELITGPPTAHRAPVREPAAPPPSGRLLEKPNEQERDDAQHAVAQIAAQGSLSSGGSEEAGLRRPIDLTARLRAREDR